MLAAHFVIIPSWFFSIYMRQERIKLKPRFPKPALRMDINSLRYWFLSSIVIIR